MYFLGYDLGSSSVKVALLEGENGRIVASAQYPPEEMPIVASQPGWAEQDPEMWWDAAMRATRLVMEQSGIHPLDVGAIGITYQMHGLVLVDEQQQVLRPAIIWCDSRAVETGRWGFKELGGKHVLPNLLNSPGNFTASKLRWVQQHEPEIYQRIYKVLLPGDYLAMRMTGLIRTTIPGLSEGIFWDFLEKEVSRDVARIYEFDIDLLPELVPVFGEQGRLQHAAAEVLGIPAGTPLNYRAGDQPNNAFSLNVLEPGDLAATAGTSGVIYGVADKLVYDPKSRVNSFAHVNYQPGDPRIGVLLCINGAGILYSWLRQLFGGNTVSYQLLNREAMETPIGADGLTVLPFGNGAERVFDNQNLGGSFHGLDFNRHQRGHMVRAAQEGVAFAMQYGLEQMRELGMETRRIRAGMANMFLSTIFRETLSGASNLPIECYDTDGSGGAARGAAIGLGYYRSFEEAFSGLRRLDLVEPDPDKIDAYQIAYQRWLELVIGHFGH